MSAQVTAAVSETTKAKLDQFVGQFGLKKSFVIEQAVLFYIASRTELPDEAFTPQRLVVDSTTFDEIVARIEDPAPTAALRELMRGDD